ncbi:RIP metalloprotease RseP [Sphingomonas panacisoli]|uniref:Zinc metalloprotease n=1 Tax=Sphingomonas panacisoli TaxID=1813879 RepID=A0A5B8LI05_9SPHN|nr:RIP metalloprotease RseP [Sphingomonas panacisoli]QDZ07516.1 RIP metalloprotease RseP [Sphingomonas panacisoli]
MQSPGFLLTIAAFLLMLGPLVFIHELGHYFVGRWCGIKADVFSIGFGREIAGWTDKRGTRWKLSLLPLGGYVRFAGDMSPAGLSDPDWLALPPEERAKTFQSKPVWQRALVVLAGPFANFLLAFILIAGFLLAYGQVVTTTEIGSVSPKSAAATAGLQRGDRITALGGRPVATFDDMVRFIAIRAGEKVTVDFDRGGRAMSQDVVIGTDHRTDKFGNKADVGLLGVGPARVAIAPVGVLEAPGIALRDLWDTVAMTGEVLGQLVTGQRSVKEMSGVVRMAKFSGEQLSLGWLAFVNLAVMISINLGFINLLPVPMLDGGHLLFYAIEAIRRRPVTPQIQEWAFRGGLAAIMLLFLVVTFNDLGAIGVWQHLAGLIG